MSNVERIVYVVDDEEIIAKSLAMILDRAGFSTHAFIDPREALYSAARGTPPDLLISDVVMPEMTGIELGIHFHRLYPRCKVLLFSGASSTAELLLNTRNDGYDFELLTKPVHPTDLLAKVREMSSLVRN
jgi:DNA-binding NtrC family response regulator